MHDGVQVHMHNVCMHDVMPYTLLLYVCTTDSTNVWMHDIIQGGEDP